MSDFSSNREYCAYESYRVNWSTWGRRVDAHFFLQLGNEFQANLELTECKHDCLIPVDQGK